MDELEKLYKDQLKADELFKELNIANTISTITDIVDSMDENMAKLVLKRFIYARGQ